MGVTLSTSARNVLCDAIVDEVDIGAGAGTIEFYTASFATLLSDITFNEPAFTASVAGVCSADVDPALQDTSANNTGTVEAFRILNGESQPLLSGTVSASGGDINFNTTSINLADSVSITSLTVTVPAS